MSVEVLRSQVNVTVVDPTGSTTEVQVKPVEVSVVQNAIEVELVDGSAISLPWQGYDFQWNVVNPFPLQVLTGRIVHVRVLVDVPFNVLSTMTIGDSINNSRLVDVSRVNLNLADTYEIHPNIVYAIGTQVNLYLNVGVGNSQGSGRIIFYLG